MLCTQQLLTNMLTSLVGNTNIVDSHELILILYTPNTHTLLSNIATSNRDWGVASLFYLLFLNRGFAKLKNSKKFT